MSTIKKLEFRIKRRGPTLLYQLFDGLLGPSLDKDANRPQRGPRVIMDLYDVCAECSLILYRIAAICPFSHPLYARE